MMPTSYRPQCLLRFSALFLLITLAVVGSWPSNPIIFAQNPATSPLAQPSVPLPLLAFGHPVDWWFVFKFNAASFPGCSSNADRTCVYGGTAQDYQGQYSLQYVYASSEHPALQPGSGCVGNTFKDPVGATFDEVYYNAFYYVIWNDQFYNDPLSTRASPWGHSKGLVAWNDNGDGFVMQVSTPSWPASGSHTEPRKTDGNTLGCIKDNDVKVSQHFFALKINKDDLVKVLEGLHNASVVTDPTNPQIVHNGGPSDVQVLVKALGKKVQTTTYMKVTLSSGVELLIKPSALHVPPWQLVSAALNGLSLRTATWWTTPKISSTTASTPISCWQESLGTPGPVAIALTGSWAGKSFNLTGGPQLNSNHTKIGVSTDSHHPEAIFGDLNQQGALSGNCNSSQNGRGGTFYIVHNLTLADGITNLLKGKTAKSSQ
jgi:hypothetical protein